MGNKMSGRFLKVDKKNIRIVVSVNKVFEGGECLNKKYYFIN